MATRIRVHQTNPKLGAIEENLQVMEALVRERSAGLHVFPECAVTGYGFSSKEEARSIAELIPGAATGRLAALAVACHTHIIFGTLERCENILFNTAVLVGPTGLVGIYRKMHLPFMGADRFVTPGDLGFPVFDTPVGRLGMLICFDLSIPEAARSLKLSGAELIVVPTNWPMAAEVSCTMTPQVRAHENHCFVVTANRVGEESGFQFRGQSRICDPLGKTLIEASTSTASIEIEIDASTANNNHQVILPGTYEIDRISTRRPLFYDTLTMTQRQLALKLATPPDATGLSPHETNGGASM